MAHLTVTLHLAGHDPDRLAVVTRIDDTIWLELGRDADGETAVAVSVGHTDVQFREAARALEQAAVAIRAAADDVKRDYQPQPGAGAEYGMEAERG